MNDNLDFEYGSGTEAFYGCGVSLKGQFWYLGGNSYRRQVKLILQIEILFEHFLRLAK